MVVGAVLLFPAKIPAWVSFPRCLLGALGRAEGSRDCVILQHGYSSTTFPLLRASSCPSLSPAPALHIHLWGSSCALEYWNSWFWWCEWSGARGGIIPGMQECGTAFGLILQPTKELSHFHTLDFLIYL